jgi:uncharacterized protein YegJ (DUF2314 family)
MKKRLVCLSLILGAPVFLLGCSSSSNKPANFSTVAEDDPEMAAAITKARKSLPDFWKKVQTPANGEDGFSLKVKIKDKNGSEHFWITDIKRQNETVSGVINNDPEIVQSVKMGQRVTVPEADISDWMYMRSGKIYGNETIHALYKTMSPDEAAAMKKMMANP